MIQEAILDKKKKKIVHTSLKNVQIALLDNTNISAPTFILIILK